MEEFQKKYVTANLPQLIEATSCSPLFLSKLRAAGVLHISDLSVLEKNSFDKLEQTKKLYEILETRKDAFELLKQALLETKQSGAYAILNKPTSKAATAGESFRNCGSISYNRSVVLGVGSNNTKVFQGKVSNRDVAVKQISCEGIDIKKALGEAAILVKLDFHENIIRYFNAEVTEEFILIALELCTMNLDTWVHTKSIPIEPVDIIRQSTSGIAHLHKMGIIHRDLKPANILIAQLPTGDFRVKISDFGMSRKIQENRSSVTLHSGFVGTLGWIAPEVVEILEHTSASEAIIKMSFASDVFSLGCIFYYVLTEGIHPFGNHMRREANILDDKFSLKLSDLKTEENGCLSLIQYMIKRNPKDRPLTSDILSHYFFWSPNKTLEFFSDVSTLISKNMNDVNQCLVRLNHTNYSNWLDNQKISVQIKKFLQEKRNCGTNIRDLLETIGYLDSYYDTLPETIKMALGPLPDKFIRNWLVRFPSLLSSTWEHFQDLKHHRILKKYYSDSFNFRDPEGTVMVDDPHVLNAPITNDEQNKRSRSPFHILKSTRSVPNLTRLVSLGDDKVEPEYVLNRAKEWETLRESTKYRVPLKRILSLPLISVNIDRFHKQMKAKRSRMRGLTIQEVREQRALMSFVKSGTLADIVEHCRKYNDPENGKYVKDIRRMVTPLHVAVIRGKLSVVEYLLNEQDFKTKINESQRRSQNSNEGQFHRLLKLCIENTNDQTAQSIEEKIKIISKLVNINKNLLTYDFGMTSPLFAENAHVDLLIHLMKLGVNMSHINDGNTILHHVSTYVNPENFHKILGAILKHGQGQMLTVKSTSGKTPMEYAMEKFEPSVATIELLKRDSDLRFGEISRLLVLAAVKNSRSVAFLKALLNAGAGWKYLDNREASLIHLSVETANIPFLEYLLAQKQTNVNVVDKFGNTAFHYVFCKAKKSRLQMTKLLVQAGININAKESRSENSAFRFAVFMRDDKQEWSDFLNYLVSKKADLNSTDGKGNTVIHDAISYLYRSQWIDSLIGWGANIKILSKNKRTVIHHAVLVRNTGILEYLFEKGVDVNAKDSDGCTALHLLFSDTNPITIYPIFPAETTYEILKIFAKNKHVNWKLKTNKGHNLWNLAIKFQYVLGTQAVQLIKSRCN